MANIYDLIPPSELTTLARLLLAAEDRPENLATLRPWFPYTQVNSINWAFDTGTTRTYTEAAPFRGFDTPSPIGKRPGRGRVSGTLPPISIKYPMRELDILQRAAMEAQGLTDIVRGDAYADVERGMRAIANRQELVMRDWLVAGSITVNDRNLSLAADAGRKANRESTVSVGWDVPATAAPLTDERNAVQILKNEQGLAASDLVTIMNDTTAYAWGATTQVKDAYQSNRALTTPLSDSQRVQVRAEQGLPDLLVIDRSIVDVGGGAAAKLIPDYMVLIVPKNERVGSTQYGIPAAALLPGIDLEADERPGPIAYVVTDPSGDPVGFETVIQALGIPVFEGADLTYALDVKP